MRQQWKTWIAFENDPGLGDYECERVPPRAKSCNISPAIGADMLNLSPFFAVESASRREAIRHFVSRGSAKPSAAAQRGVSIFRYAIVSQTALQFAPQLEAFDLVAQLSAEQFQTAVDVESFQEPLFERRVLAKTERCDVDERFGVLDRFEERRQFFRSGSGEPQLQVE